MTDMRRVFFVSDRTGITAEALGCSLLTQFAVATEQATLPFVDTPERARSALQRIETVSMADRHRPIVFSTIIDQEVLAVLRESEKIVLFDFFDTFIQPLERELKIPSQHIIGRSHGIADDTMYDVRIEAMNFALHHDDGATLRHYGRADIILVGVSRSGKTPAALYLALQYGIYAANYPLTADDFSSVRARSGLPEGLRQQQDRLFGLTIDPDRLHQIRQERRPNSRYAELRQCELEVARAEAMFRRERIPYMDITTMSIEEIASTLIHQRGLPRRV
ncbi:phosphoenolpyruvate synthase regulatory protein [Halorhodospira abdelmalekii]|uniref:posphoenolpyruvate synthetase regulatory kinase/phosphorylase PpsR n=1 Tax=Halorhodospira abdelmalekii TaxID=421629 RepID=UPI001F5B7CA8|nr:pyruvate, water dikinase regulatory protein [Halorhodospira abdelmalekii]MBK1733823.1 phosphoenolpyruvate synthase regulatory protein [Halorhodospira abdelmalekii]